MMVDLGSFLDEKFDTNKWINAACRQGRHPQDPVEKHLVDVEMKLQIMSEEIAALLRVPRASRDVIRLRDDAVSLHTFVASILLKLKKAEESSAESIATLAKVDTVKRRMEAAYETLQDAAGLTQLSATVEDVFASGDLPRAAETLANMRHCLPAVGEVAEFANIRKQLEVLEDRLDTMVKLRLTDALTNLKVDIAQDMRSILIRIGRFKSLEQHYTKVNLKPIRKLWENFKSLGVSKIGIEKIEAERSLVKREVQSNLPTVSFSSWLPSFYDELLLYLEHEWKWCMVSFPDDYKGLVPKLLIETMTSISANFTSRINLATGDVVPETKALTKGILDVLSGDMPKGIKLLTKHLEALIELHNITGIFAKNIHHLFSDSYLQILLETLKRKKYGQMEHAILFGEIAGLDLRGAVVIGIGGQGVELSETVRRMEESIPQVILHLEAAVERCINLTGGSEADELILSVDDVILQYILALQETLKSLRVVCGLDAASSTSDVNLKKENGTGRNEEEWSIVQGALQILTVADCLTSRSSVFEASLRATLARVRTSMSISVFGGGDELTTSALDFAAVRLLDAPEKARKLFHMLEQSKDPPFHALPLASQRVAAFAETVNELVYNILISKVRQRVNGVSHLSVSFINMGFR